MSALAANATTTISTDIVTGGSLTVSGTSALTGAVTLSSNITVPSGYGLDATSGALNLGTTTATSVIIGSSSAKVGIASTSPYVALGVTGTTTSSAGVVIGAIGSPVTQMLFGTCSVNLPSINATSTVTANCTAAGVNTIDKVFVTPTSLPNYVVFTSASSTAADIIQVAAFNIGSSTGQTVDPAASTWSWMAVR